MLFALLLCQCADRKSQRSQAIWLKRHWRWIVRAWIQAKGERPERDGPPSQPTISRVLSSFDPRYLSRLMTMFARDGFAGEWGRYVEKTKKKQQNRNAGRKSRRPKVSRLTYVPARKKWPQFCLDGKARGGCISLLTGRTEIDLTLYSPETSQVLGHTTLPDKVGEQTAAFGLIFTTAGFLPSGIFTGDAGITSPANVKMIRDWGHGYRAQSLRVGHC